jgi:hypothetical protein
LDGTVPDRADAMGRDEGAAHFAGEGKRLPNRLLFPTARGHLRRALKFTAIAFYCIAIFLALDFAVSTLAPGVIVPMQTSPGGKPARIQDPVYDHTLAPRFDGVDSWGEARYRLLTNSLGFKDETTREVAAKSGTRRILLIGDSFTEGVGLEFADTFAGMLYRAGREQADKVEVLNAGVVSYSPTIYYKKIKHLLEGGLQFDHVVVLPDLSDVQDEAWFYFCIDDIPEYRARCNTTAPPDSIWFQSRTPTYWQTHFVLTDRLRLLVKRQLQAWSGKQKQFVMTPNARTGWVVPGYDVGNDYAPLGVDGAIERSLRHMQALADLLAARNIALSVAVYPWPMQVAIGDRDSRQVRLWREFCAKNCKSFIDLFPDMFAAKDAHADWYGRYFIHGDNHYSAEGNRLLFRGLAKHLLPAP